MKVAVIGTAGIPANYGGFETLAQNLAYAHEMRHLDFDMEVYCSGKNYQERPSHFLNTKLRYLPLEANGISSITYDVISILMAVINRSDTILVLGVSGAIALPALRVFTGKRVVTNIDGIEWRRDKWRGLARWFLRLSERCAVRYSDVVIADNAAIASYIQRNYGVLPTVIAYGGDHALHAETKCPDQIDLPKNYAVSVCRIEPENNIHIILEAFSNTPEIPLIMVGNWTNSRSGQNLRATSATHSNISLLDPIYDPGILKYLRLNARLYIHGHSAGGTNPSLVEAMHFGMPILAYDCDFNQSTTEQGCLYFSDIETLVAQLKNIDSVSTTAIGEKMKEIASRRYTWAVVANQYFESLVGPAKFIF